ncbi:MAG TPA: hypothetical protein VLM89_08450 [Phycisphaerae bacterium]|nr:hypothetical protein [Phycisphaerae bacterium]
MTWRKPGFSRTAAILILGGILGCEQPSHRAAVADREQKFSRTVAMLQDIESERPENLQRTVNMLEAQHRQDVEAFQASTKGLRQDVQDEFDRWRERQPFYAERLRELMKGNPANIDRTLPWVLY